MGTVQAAVLPDSHHVYTPRGRNALQTICEKHFHEFCNVYEESYAERYGKFRLDRISEVGEHFLACSDYLQGVARIKCTNPDCGHDYFRPFSCKGFYLCPSCSQKRTLLFAEHLVEEVLLELPHRQFVFTFPKALRVFFRYDRRLFADISRLIFSMVQEFYHEVVGTPIQTGMVIAHQTFGDMMRFNPHYHAIILEGGFDEEGRFISIPFAGLQKITEYFRRKVIWLFVKKELINEEFARNLLSWKHSGFSIDNSVRMLDRKSRENIGQYMARPPLSLKKITYEPFKRRVLFHTTYSDYFKENLHMFNALDFLAELTQHIPPKGVQLIRRYGLYSSRIKGAWDDMPYVGERAPDGWKEAHVGIEVSDDPIDFDPFLEDDSVDSQAYKRAWARLLAKVYEVDPFVCPKCGSEMKVIAIIQETDEIKPILRHSGCRAEQQTKSATRLVKIGRSPPGFDPVSLN